MQLEQFKNQSSLSPQQPNTKAMNEQAEKYLNIARKQKEELLKISKGKLVKNREKIGKIK